MTLARIAELQIAIWFATVVVSDGQVGLCVFPVVLATVWIAAVESTPL